ncbi:hypothetical protein A9P82_05670 [Arachidicoccus ginsenosidimutans]|uniref:hypothetical protein n=1 Tax=Arachidicoccus sp. BS20 TaxID=1850526 RepID=UPI0007F15B00|nr:hypothetical protein [Arachidicoccus sp. BS20]ANI88821.1 hypothetical protein A9P82_05670 [Arachidicoccus sp. BS20]
MVLSFEGHHGTSIISAKAIINSNYQLSYGDNEWLGDGVYFFVQGVSSKTIELAEKWAVAQAWDNDNKEYKYKEYCILQSLIDVEDAEFLDLTIEDGVEILNYLVDKYKDKIESIGKNIKFYDGLILNLARNEGILPLEVVKGNFYIKFAKERIEKINLRTNNCTICTVYNPSKSISSNSIIKTGTIK